MASIDSKSQESQLGPDAGFGLVEIVVSMFILALIAIAFLPLLIQGVQVTANNRSLATATQLVHDQLERARSLDTCSALVAFEADATQPNPDFEVIRTVLHPTIVGADPCTIDYPGVLKVTIEVERADDAVLLVGATTLILVRTEN